VTLSEKQKNEYRAAFRLFDKDKDGYISNDELVTVMRSIGHHVNQSELRELFSPGGDYTSRGGKIDFDMFCNLMTDKMKDVDSEKELKDAFRVLDDSGRGYINCKELQQICSKLGETLTEEQVGGMVREAISNFDGKIYYDGFKKIMIAH